MSSGYTPTQGDLENLIRLNQLSPYEQAAGVTAPTKYQGTTDANGYLIGGYKVDPYSGPATQMIRDQAMGQGPSAWALMQTQAQKQEQAAAADQAMKQGMQAQSGAMNNLARFGGATGGASALMARSGMRDQLNAQQGVAQQGIQARLGINATDAQSKQNLLGKLGDLETQASSQNAQLASQNNVAQNAFNTNRYNQQMAAWGAKETANGMRASGGGGKK